MSSACHWRNLFHTAEKDFKLSESPMLLAHSSALWQSVKAFIIQALR